MNARYVGGYDAKAVSDQTGLACLDPSRAIQSMKEEADINTIVRQFGITGKLPENVVAPQYGDFTGVDDYRSAIEAIKNAESAFAQMPAAVRERFAHDPAAFVDFCSDERNREEMLKLGLIDKPGAAPGQAERSEAS